MNFQYPASYLKLAEEVGQFARRELTHNVAAADAAATWSKENWQTCADFGIQGLHVPVKYGGRYDDTDVLRTVMAMEALGKNCADNGLSFALSAQMWTVQEPIRHFGDETQKEKYLTGMVKGNIIAAHALTEPRAGSDVYALATTAEKTADGYKLNGKKRYITLGPVADAVLIIAKTNPKAGQWGMTAFIVDTEAAGFIQSDPKSKSGLRTVPFGELEMKDCHVPETARLGREGAGFAIMQHSLEYDRCCVQAWQVGAMQRQLDAAVAYAKERKQFGQSIGKFQSVGNRLANMKLRLETARLLLYKAAWLKQNNQPALTEAALLKLHLGESYLQNSLDAVRTYGGHGYLTETGAERDLRDALGGVIYAGTADVQRNIIARLLGV